MAPISLPEKVNVLHGVHARAADDVWAVGYSSENPVYQGNGFFADFLGTGARTLIMHWDGKEWQRVPSPNPAPDSAKDNNILHGVWAVAHDEAWAAGSYVSGGVERTLILNWDGTRWNHLTSPNPHFARNRLFEIQGLSANDIWAVGAAGYDFTDKDASKTLIVRWNGREWTQVPSPSPGAFGNLLYDIALMPDGKAWSVGVTNHKDFLGVERLALFWNGAEWSQVNLPGEANILKGVSTASGDHVVAAGSLAMEGGSKAIPMEWDAPNWIAPPFIGLPGRGEEFLGHYLDDVDAAHRYSAWAVGTVWQHPAGTQALIAHWDGQNWQEIRSPQAEPGVLPTPIPGTGGLSNDLRAVSTLPSGEAWAVGVAKSGDLSQPLIFHYRIDPCPTPPQPPRPITATPEPHPTPGVTGLKVGDIAPDFSLPTISGDEFKLSSWRGTPVVLNFWGTWCPPCRAEMPNIHKVSERYNGRVEFVGISMGPRDNSPDVKSFVEQAGY